MDFALVFVFWNNTTNVLKILNILKNVAIVILAVLLVSESKILTKRQFMKTEWVGSGLHPVFVPVISAQ
jgi:hypothetical protein